MSRWWVVDLRDEPVPGHHLVPAPTGRQAIAAFRRLLTGRYRDAGDSARTAAGRVRAGRPVVYAGPLTPRDAYRHLVSWEWAHAIAARRQEQAGTPAEPASPVSRALAAELLGLARTAEIEASCMDEIGE